MDQELMKTLVQLHVENPNDFEFGGEIRKIVWDHIANNSPAY